MYVRSFLYKIPAKKKVLRRGGDPRVILSMASHVVTETKSALKLKITKAFRI